MYLLCVFNGTIRHWYYIGCLQTAEEAMTPIESTFSLDVNSKIDWCVKLVLYFRNVNLCTHVHTRILDSFIPKCVTKVYLACTMCRPFISLSQLSFKIDTIITLFHSPHNVQWVCKKNKKHAYMEPCCLHMYLILFTAYMEPKYNWEIVCSFGRYLYARRANFMVVVKNSLMRDVQMVVFMYPCGNYYREQKLRALVVWVNL